MTMNSRRTIYTSLFVILLTWMMGISLPMFAVIPTEGLVAYYPFNGNANDESGNGNHATPCNSYQYEEGIVGSCITVEGNGYVTNTGGHVMLPQFDFDASAGVTLSLWVKALGLTDSDGESYINFGDETKKEILRIHQEPSKVTFQYHESMVTVPYLDDYTGNWVMYALTCGANGKLRAYINGTLVGEENVDYDGQINTSLAALGRHWWYNNGTSSTRFRGSFDEVRIYNRVLTADEVKNLAQYAEIGNITFADAEVKRICVENWDTNGDGELSKDEVAAVTDLGQVFRNKKIKLFDELQYFTGLTKIGENAFEYCSGLTSVTIPNSVTSIGNDAFYRCSGLTSVTIPNSVTSIGQGAFYNCSGLTSVTIGNGVTKIGSQAFSSCNGLTSVHISDIAAWCKIAFSSNPLSYAHHLYLGEEEITDLVIPNSVTSIGNYAFSDCSGLTSITIPNSVTSIGGSAFLCCSGLISIKVESGNTTYDSRDNCNAIIETNTNTLITGCKNTVIPNSVTSIGDDAFSGCSGLTSVTIPNSVTSIGQSAFSNCSGLTSVTIPNSVTSIGWDAFSGCSGLTSPVYNSTLFAKMPTSYTGSYSIPDGIKEIYYQAFEGCGGLTSVTIPNSVTSIGMYAFLDCSGLTTVKIGNGVTSIGDSAFEGCGGLTSVHISDIAAWCKIAFSDTWRGGHSGVTFSNPLVYAGHLYLGDEEIKDLVIPNSVTSIGGFAFEGCRGLTSITIPNSVTSIGDNAFLECSGLTSVHISDIAAWCKIAFIDTGIKLIIGDRGASFSNPLFYANHLYLGEEEIKDLVIPNSVTSIGDNAFEYCIGLTSVNIPNSVTSIGKYAFDGCSGLISGNIPASVTFVGEGIFNNTAIFSLDWESRVKLKADLVNNLKAARPNVLIYVKDENVLPEKEMENVVVNGTAEKVVLTENSPFYCAKAFTAKNISLTHNFTMETGKGSAAGWETIALPFYVQSITHETKGSLVPFANYTSGSNSKPFWLYELKSNGFTKASSIQANKPYLISMPNNAAYSSEFCLNGKVTFTGTNVTVKKTDDSDLTTVSYNGKTFKPTFMGQTQDNTVYAINATSDYSSETGGQTAGSLFIKNLRAVRPFEAYFDGGTANAREFITIDFADDDATGIDEIMAEGTAVPVKVYDLKGQIVSSTEAGDADAAIRRLPAGIYVVNGRKVAVK